MKAFSSLVSIIGALVFCMFAQSAQAALNCEKKSGEPFNGTMTLQISTITVPRDAPLGTRIYMQSFNQAGPGVVFKCDVNNATMKAFYSVQGAKKNTNSTANAYYAGKIYETDIPGIGVAWYAGHGKMPGEKVGPVGMERATGTTPAGCGVPPVSSGVTLAAGVCNSSQLKLQPVAAVVLIKIGPVETGTIIGSNLGQLVYDVAFDDSREFSVARLGLTGNINIVAQTCRTPDVNVAMGSGKTSAFTGVGSATPQVKFEIALTGCPGFAGYFGKTDCYPPTCNPTVFNIPAASQTGPTQAGNVVPNTLSIQVDPVTTPIDAANGVLSLATGTDAMGRPMATGVGVQLLDSSGAPRALSTPQQLSNELSAAPNSSINISLGARYLQTANTVTAGKANAVATYTIIYQ